MSRFKPQPTNKLDNFSRMHYAIKRKSFEGIAWVQLFETHTEANEKLQEMLNDPAQVPPKHRQRYFVSAIRTDAF